MSIELLEEIAKKYFPDGDYCQFGKYEGKADAILLMHGCFDEEFGSAIECGIWAGLRYVNKDEAKFLGLSPDTIAVIVFVDDQGFSSYDGLKSKKEVENAIKELNKLCNHGE